RTFHCRNAPCPACPALVDKLGGSDTRAALQSLRYLQTTLYGRSSKTTFQPSRHLLQAIEINELTGPVESDEVAHPTEHRNIGDCIVIAHDPMASMKACFHDTEYPFRLVQIVCEGAFVGNLTTCELVEVADLAEHRPDEGHLKEQPLDRLTAARCITRQKTASLLGEIEQDRAGSEKPERRTAGPVGINDRRNLAVRVQGQELRRLLLVHAEVDDVRLIGHPHLLERDRNLDPIGRWQRIELEAIRMFGRPARCDRKA